METWYQVNKWDSSIKEVKVVKHTEQFITLAASESYSGKIERRTAKRQEYHPTFAEARTWLLNYYSRIVDNLKQDAQNYCGLYDRVFMKDKPDPK